MRRVKFTTLTGESAASSLLFGVRALKIMNTNLLPRMLSLSCSHLYAFCSGSELLFVVIIAKQKVCSLFACVFTLPIFLGTQIS